MSNLSIQHIPREGLVVVTFPGRLTIAQRERVTTAIAKAKDATGITTTFLCLDESVVLEELTDDQLRRLGLQRVPEPPAC